MKRIITLIFTVQAFFSNAQLKEKLEQYFKFQGFVNLQAFYDTRQNLEAREGMFTFYPLNAKYDNNRVDLNAKDNLNFLAMTTRLGVNIQGGNALGAKLSGLIETDFTGVSNNDNNGLRLRHAYLTLDWEKRKLLIGHYWHPLYVPEAPVNSIALNSGAPFHSFSRINQLRYTEQLGHLSLIGVAGTQLDYANEGPVGRTPDYMQNAVIPNLHLQFHYKLENHLLGAGVDYKILVPSLVTAKGFATHSSIDSWALLLFSRSDFGKYQLKLQAVWGQNLTDHLMLGGYAEAKVDTIKENIEYTTIDQLSAWMVFEKMKGNFRPGIFCGYLKNLGAAVPVEGKSYGRGIDIGYVYRIGPRLVYWAGKLMLALELEYTVAAYGTPDTRLLVRNTKEYANLRTLLGAFYFF